MRLALLVSALSVAGGAGAQQLRCSAHDVGVEAEDAYVAERVCEALSSAKNLLDECGLTPVLGYTIGVVDQMTHRAGGCLAHYDCEGARIEVLDPARFDEVLEPDSVLRRIDRDALFASLVIHEWAHAVLDEVSLGQVRDPGDQEYVAYAMQLAALSPEDRQIWLDAFPASDEPRSREINGIIAAIEPLRFATRAWRYFSADGRGCATVHGLISGETSFGLGHF